MTVLPFNPSPAAAPAPVPAIPTGTGDAGVGDFLAAFLAAMHGDAPETGSDAAPVAVADAAPRLVEEGALAAPRLDEEGALAAPRLVEEGALAAPRLDEEGALAASRLVEEGALAPVSKPGDQPTEEPATEPPVLDPTLATVAPLPNLMAPQLAAVPVPTLSPRSVEEGALAAPRRLVEEGALAPVSKPPAPRRLVEEGALAAPRLVEEGALAPVSKPPAPDLAVPNLSAAAIPSSPTATAASAAAPTAPPVANTAPLDRVAAQVFPEVTGLVSRGNGTHRITMTLNPEQLGEVRVVMTIRDGAVHVRMAAGHEARAALLDGSPELSRLLESSGASETRIVVRELPAAALTATSPTPTSTADFSSAGNGSLDQRAGTRADHQAKDGSDHHAPRPHGAEAQTSTGAAPRSNQSVTGTRAAGVDLTM